MIFNVSGGGGTALNFRVVGGTTEPSNPKENMIWVNTSTTISSWVFSATQPSNPSNGMVWISTGTSSTVEFNALKKNGIHVYPISAKQYVSGAWVDKIAMSYQNGEWVDWVTYLYKSSNQFSEITGGWACNKNIKFFNMAVSGTIECGEYLTVKASSNSCYNATTVNKVNLTEFSKLLYDIAPDSSENDMFVYIHSITSGQLNENYVAASNNGEINLAGISGEYYITVGSDNNRNIKVGNIRLVN